MKIEELNNKKLKEVISSIQGLKDIWPKVGLAGYIGSLSHGTNGNVIDDVDVMGTFISDKRFYLGFGGKGVYDNFSPDKLYDFVFYEFKKLIHLLYKSNPNVISLLWLREQDYIICNEWGKRLIDNRQLFMSKQLFKTFGGYAVSQLKHMTRINEGGYQGSLRRERFEKFGYDLKNASHLIRLLRTGIEALITGEINVFRYDAVELKDIKEGKWTKEKVEKEADRLNKLLSEALVKSDLPPKPDKEKIEDLLIEILEENL